MRWKFYTPGERPEEDAQRAAVIGRIDAWWKAFEAKAESLDSLFNGLSDWDLVAWSASCRASTRGGWIQFFDNVLGAEWIGLWPNGPPSPMPAT